MEDRDTLEQQLVAIQAKRANNRQRRRRPSKLDRYRDQIKTLNKLEASLADIAEWLATKQVRTSRSAVHRALKKWNGEAS